MNSIREALLRLQELGPLLADLEREQGLRVSQLQQDLERLQRQADTMRADQSAMLASAQDALGAIYGGAKIERPIHRRLDDLERGHEELLARQRELLAEINAFKTAQHQAAPVRAVESYQLSQGVSFLLKGVGFLLLAVLAALLTLIFRK